MGFWDKSLRIFKCLCDNGGQSVRRIAEQTGLSKSSVHRLKQAMERRGRHPESWLWETEDGRQWLTRLVVAVLYVFGLKHGVGVETLSEFFARLRLDTQVGCSPSALRQVMRALEEAVLETAQTWEQDGIAHGAVREIIGGADETFLQRMILIFQDVPTGYLLLEEVADDRTYTTWKARVDERLKALGTAVWYVVSDRAKALIQLAEQGLECFSMPDFFHVTHEIVKSYSLALGRHVRQAHKDLTHAKDALARCEALSPAAAATAEAQTLVDAKQAEVTRWEAAHNTYRGYLMTLSLTLHPVRLTDSAPQTSTQVESQLQTTVAAIEAFAQRSQLPARPQAMSKVRKQVPALAALVDVWWHSVQQDVASFHLSSRWHQWVCECLLPMVYWDHQVARTRCRRRKANMQAALDAVRGVFERHAITQRLAPQVLADWHAWAADRVHVFQRASSAVEGRNGYLSQMQHNQRGLPTRRSKVWTAVHNFDCRAADGTTPASRFFRRTFPELFETVLLTIEEMPRSRERKQARALSN
jgi:hypothetical protein